MNQKQLEAKITTAGIWVAGRIFKVSLIEAAEGRIRISISRNGIKLSEEAQLETNAIKEFRKKSGRISKILTDEYIDRKKAPAESEIMELIKAIFQPA